MNRESKEIYLQVEGMHCAACVNSIEKGLSKLDGVNSCRVNLAMGTAVISIDDNKINTEKIGQEIEQLGFSATESQPDFLAHSLKEINTAKSNFFLSLLFAVPLMVIAMTPMFASVYLFSETVDILAQAILSGLLIILPGRSIIFDALKQAIHFRANMNTLIAIGTLSAFFWSLYQLIVYQIDITDKIFFESSGMIICLILLGRFLEAKAKGKAGEAIGSLLNLMPSSTTAIINDVEVDIDPSTAQPGMILIVKPGERIPTDGKIIEGNPTIDESMLTGESIPVDKRKGDQVLSGSLNGNISFRLEVTVPSDKSYLAGIIRLVSEAQSRKAPVQLLADKIASIFVPIVIGIALVTLALWYAFDPSSPMLMKSVISVLIISCPCALGLATPTAVLTGTGRAAKEGVLIKGGDVLEKINDIDTIVFDKTGTLTYGDLEVTEIHSFGQYSENHLLRIIGSLEMQSEHPIAEAIVRQMKATQL